MRRRTAGRNGDPGLDQGLSRFKVLGRQTRIPNPLGFTQCCSLKRIKPLPELSKKPNFQCVEASHAA